MFDLRTIPELYRMECAGIRVMSRINEIYESLPSFGNNYLCVRV